MEIEIETKRLLIRDIRISDATGMFEMDSDPEVHRFLGNNPVKSLHQVTEVIERIRQQYIENGIGRWAMIEKKTGDFVGWTGLKLVKELTNNHIDFYDLGYRLGRKYWGLGYATESARASLTYGFTVLKPDHIFGTAEVDHHASRHVLQKCGLQKTAEFVKEERPYHWFEISGQNWEKQNNAWGGLGYK